MTRISNLLFATSLAILPMSAFAQQNVAPVQPAAKTSEPAVKMPVATKDTHAKLGAKTVVPAKTAEPSKS